MASTKAAVSAWVLAWLLLGLAWSSAAAGQDRRTNPAELTIMTFNAEFLWDGIDPEEGSAEFAWRGDPDAAEDHMRRIAEVIARADADIVHLVEVEDGSVVRLMRDKFLSGRGYEVFFIRGRDFTTGQDVCLLSRVDPVTVAGASVRRDERQGQSSAGSSVVRKGVTKHLIARFALSGGITFSIIGAHLLAIPPHTGRVLDRQAQADALVGMARDERAAGFDPVILGDLNDYDGAADAIDHAGNAPITRVLAILRAQDPADPADDLVNAAAWVAPAGRYTSWYDENRNGLTNFPKEFTSIDHILLPASLASRVISVEIHQGHDPVRVSDHFPVVVRLRTGAASPAPTAGAVRISKLLPDPAGDDRQHEKVWIVNRGSTAVSLTGWKLRDKGGATWDLGPLGTIAAGETKMIQRLGQAMSLNNDGDTIEVLDASGTAVHTVTYDRAGTDEEVEVGV